MTYWLLKSEPRAWSWEEQVIQGTTHWDGVRNFQASNNLKAMRTGDLALFYHSGEEKAICGIVEIVKEYYPDPSDPKGRFGMVDVKTYAPFQHSVSLKSIKENPHLHHLALVRQSRLSVMPIDDKSWALLCKMGGVSEIRKQESEIRK